MRTERELKFVADRNTLRTALTIGCRGGTSRPVSQVSQQFLDTETLSARGIFLARVNRAWIAFWRRAGRSCSAVFRAR